MEKKLKQIVLKTLESKLGTCPSISSDEWDDAKRESFNDIYINKFCFLENVALGYFIETMVNLLYIEKRDI